MKRIVKTILAVSICIMGIIFLISCGGDVNGEKSLLDFELSSDGNYYTITGIGKYTEPSLIIPSTYEGMPVSAIGKGAFSGNETITEVVIPKSITVIGAGAFQNIPNLTKVTFEENGKLEVIDDGAFERCHMLTSVKIPSSVTEIGANAFKECTTLSVVEIESIESWCGIKFENETSNPAYYSLALTLGEKVISNLVIPEGVSEIGDYTFSYNTAINTVSIPKSVAKIGKFESCINLVEIIYNAKNATCEASPFEKAGNATDKIKVIIGADVEVLPKEIFSNSAHITSLDMSGASALSEIGDKAFFNAENLESVTSIPTTVKKIGSNAFDGCKKIFTFEDGVYYIGTWAVSRTNGVPTNLTIREGTVGIASGVFYNCVSLQNLTLPASLKMIGVASFRDCPSLKTINLVENSSLTYVGDAGFYNCTSLSAVKIHSSKDWAKINFESKSANPLTQSSAVALYLDGQKVTELIVSDINEIGTYAFKDYLALTKVELNNVKKIGANAFENCNMITHISLSSEFDVTIEDNAFFNLKSLSEINYNIKSITVCETYNGVFYNAGKDNSYGIYFLVGEEVESISASLFKTKSSENSPKITTVQFSESGALKTVPSCFEGISTLKTVYIPEGFSSLDSCCFRGCTGISKISLPSTITEIGGSAFEGCSSLIQINLPEGLTKIGSGAFASTGIVSLEFPTTLKSIGASAFYKCANLSSINAFPSALAEIGDIAFYESAITGVITIPESVTSLGRGVFVRTKITEAHIPNTLISLGEQMFEGCSELTSVTVPDSITKIEANTFNGCSKLSQFTIPSRVTSIGASAFERCSSLTSIALPEGLTEIGNGAFKQCSKITELYLPSTLVTIGEEAFFYVKSITKIVVPKSVKAIGKGAFSHCSSLREMTLPFIGNSAELNKEFTYTETEKTYFGYIFGNGDVEGVKIEQFVRGGLNNESYEFTLPKNLSTLTVTSDHIPTYSLSDCSTIKTLKIQSEEINLARNSISYLESVVTIALEGKITEIAPATFSGCTSLTNITVTDNKIVKIGESAFADCASLVSLPLEILETIGNGAFSGCSSLKNINFPSSLKSIGALAFEGCSALESVTFALSDGWSVKNENDSFGIRLNLPSRNATYLIDSYKHYKWEREKTSDSSVS
ncbi:MAG: leucine-rich repeat protein [Clostridia bacterium]|nr:leucine-rich repeat protein [Clostridia bacterium]